MGKKTTIVNFVIWKSYDGGKHWERECRLPDFAAAAEAAYSLRTRHPMIRFRVDAELSIRAAPGVGPGPAREKHRSHRH